MPQANNRKAEPPKPSAPELPATITAIAALLASAGGLLVAWNTNSNLKRVEEVGAENLRHVNRTLVGEHDFTATAAWRSDKCTNDTWRCVDTVIDVSSLGCEVAPNIIVGVKSLDAGGGGVRVSVAAPHPLRTKDNFTLRANTWGDSANPWVEVSYLAHCDIAREVSAK